MQSNDALPKTKVIILGVNHSAQLVAESYQPAIFRAFFDQIAPAVICVERAPHAFDRNDHYEFTYEVQYLALPYARERRIPVYPIDWTPSRDDELLGWGIELEPPPFVRKPTGFQGFLSFPNRSELYTSLFFADEELERQKGRDWYEHVTQPARFDLARRLFLYRTFMQAQRIIQVAHQCRSQVVLVVIGALHKDEIERILDGFPEIDVVQPSSFGLPSPCQVAAHVRREDFVAIASFNLLGVQSATQNVNWDWITRVVTQLKRVHLTPEVHLFVTRLAALRQHTSLQAIGEAYQHIREVAAPNERFTWSGVKDQTRVDSYFDPFGNLSVPQRATLELARTYYGMRRGPDAEALREQLVNALSAVQRQQLQMYWEAYVAATKRKRRYLDN